MKEIIINVDAYNQNSIKTIEGDNLSEVYKIYICKNKRRIDLTNKIAVMAYVNEYGSKKSNILALNITNAAEGEIELPITNVISNENGVYACQIAIYGENNSLEQTAPFSLIVENNIFSKISNTAINSSDFHILSEAIKTTNEYSEKLKQGTENIELQYAENLNKKADEIDLIVERKRIDLLTKMENGETEGNTELLDIRVGADGNTYDTAGKAVREQITKIKKQIPYKNLMSNSFEWEGYKLKVADVGQIVGIGSSNSKYFNKQEIDLTNHNRGVAYFDCSEPEPLKIKLLENFLEATEEFYNNPNIAIVGFRDFGRKFCNHLNNSEILSSKFIVHDNSFYIKNDKVCVNDNAFIIGGGSNWIKIPKNDTGYTLNIADVLVINIASGIPVIENWTWNNVVGKQNYNINSYKSTCIPIAYKDNNGKIHLVTKNDGDIEKIIADITEMKNQIGEITSGKTNWTDKKIVWFGTSIPAGEHNKNYPSEIGKLLKANVVNEAWGSSPARCGQRSKVSHDDPRGWFGLAWQNVAFALSGTLEEKNEIINNWDYWKMKFSNNPPDALSETMKGYIRDCSYENRLMRHIGDGKRADLYVFDHGFNDFLDGSDLETVPHDIKDRKTFIGAMNFLIDIILKDNPRARIILIGHYENQFRPSVALAQTKLAESWSLPFYKQWEKLGWSSNRINTTGYWDNGNWIESGGSPTDRKIKDIWLADGVHPHSDKSGRATNHIIKNMLPFFLNLN